jgi:hypothetical protein
MKLPTFLLLLSTLVSTKGQTICHICGVGNVVGDPDAIFEVSMFGISIPCGDLEMGGLNGQISSFQCGLIQPGGMGASYMEPCECMKGPSTDETSSVPSAEPTSLEPTTSEPTTLEPSSSESPTTYPPSSTPTQTSSAGDRSISESTCIDTPGWADADNFSCQWYEQNEPLGCPIYGDLRPWKFKDGVVEPSFGDGTANQNCCHCRGSAAPTPKPTSSCSGDTINWRDNENYTCSWYENNDALGCPRFGDSYEGSMGVANDNCCWCKGTGAPTSIATSAFPTVALYPTPSPSTVTD